MTDVWMLTWSRDGEALSAIYRLPQDEALDVLNGEECGDADGPIPVDYVVRVDTLRCTSQDLRATIARLERERDEAAKAQRAPILVSSNGEAGDYNENCGCCGDAIGLDGAHEWKRCAERLSDLETDAVNRLVDMHVRAETAEQERDAAVAELSKLRKAQGD